MPVDKNLIEAFRNGDHEAFGYIVSQSLEPCLRLAMRFLERSEDAEDLVQDCFIRVWEKRRYVKSAESFIPWVRKIIVNRCYDFLRREQTRAKYRDENRESELYKSADSEAPDLELRLAESEETLRIITSMLSPKQRIVFILSEIEEMSVKEIKDITGMTSNSIKSNCYHARKRAREIFELLDKR